MILYSVSEGMNSTPIAKLTFKGPSLLFPTGRHSYVNYESDDATLLAFDESHGIHTSSEDPYLGFFPKFDPKTIQPQHIAGAHKEEIHIDDNIGMIDDGAFGGRSTAYNNEEKNMVLQQMQESKVE